MNDLTDAEIKSVLAQEGSVDAAVKVLRLHFSLVPDWHFEKPKERFATFLKTHPLSHWNVDERKGGSAIMKSIDHDPSALPGSSGWWQIEIRDHSVPHGTHKDFMVLSIHKEVSPDKVSDVLSLSDSVNYERTTSRLSTMCHFMGANVATLALALQIADGTKTAEQAKSDYMPNIKKTVKSERTYLKYLNALGLYSEPVEEVSNPRSLYDGGSKF